METREFRALTYSFKVSGGATIYTGQEIYLHTDGTVRPVSTAAHLPIGFATQDVADGETATFETYFHRVSDNAYVAGSTATGALVKQNATLNSGKPVYVAATTGYNNTIVLVGRANAGTITVGVLRSPMAVTIP